MSTPLSNGGATLAPTPAQPHHLSRQPSKEDLELAENLNLLNHSHDRPPASRETDAHSENNPPPTSNGTAKNNNEQVSEYHSLEDTLGYHANLPNNPPADDQQPPPPQAQASQPAMSTPASTPRRSLGGSVPVNGQICR
jgi:GATA-binding protein, other eukaryote